MPERLKFYLDEHVDRAVADGLYRRGVDVLRAQDAGMHPAPDSAHLDLARGEGRVIFTQDADFLRLHAAGKPHTGIVYVPQHTAVGTIVAALMLIYEVLSPEEMINPIEFV